MARRNDSDRREWMDNDEGFYNWWKSTGLNQRNFIRGNRAEIDKAIDIVLDRKKPAHYLAYGDTVHPLY